MDQPITTPTQGLVLTFDVDIDVDVDPVELCWTGLGLGLVDWWDWGLGGQGFGTRA